MKMQYDYIDFVVENGKYVIKCSGIDIVIDNKMAENLNDKLNNMLIYEGDEDKRPKSRFDVGDLAYYLDDDTFSVEGIKCLSGTFEIARKDYFYQEWHYDFCNPEYCNISEEYVYKNYYDATEYLRKNNNKEVLVLTRIKL